MFQEKFSQVPSPHLFRCHLAQAVHQLYLPPHRAFVILKVAHDNATRQRAGHHLHELCHMCLGDLLAKEIGKLVPFHRLQLHLPPRSLLQPLLEVKGAVVARAKELEDVRAGLAGSDKKGVCAGFGNVLEAYLQSVKL